jgi:adenylate cyclase
VAVEPVERVERRLAAILAADVVGYSRLMGEDEVGTLDRLKAHRSQLVDPKIREHRGRIVKTTGDGILVEFASVVDAVSCAVQVQRGMVDRNASTPENKRILWRVGINLGDVIIDGEDIHGDGVNVAARLEALADPGGICVSRTVRNQVRDKLPYSFDDMGEQSVKNIARPVRADAMSAAAVAATPLVAVAASPPTPRRRITTRHAVIAASLVMVVGGIGLGAWWTWPHTASPPAPASPQGSRAVASPGAKPAPHLSIVVLPFASLSNDPDQEYFADGITDDLTTDLSRISDSFVISRNTAFTYKGKPVEVKKIGSELGVRYVLEGSVRRSGDEVQVNVQLIDAESGAHVWADRFNTDRTNIARMQDEITGRLAQSLQVRLLEAAGHQIEQEKNPDARDMVMRGWASYYRPYTKDQAEETLRYFEQALAMDPQSIDAKVGIAEMLVENVIKKSSQAPEEDKARADQLLHEVFERDRNNLRALQALGLLRRQQGRLTEARIAFEEEISLDRNISSARLQLGYTLTFLGEPEAALPHFEKTIQLDPHSQNIFYFYSGIGFCNILLGNSAAAIDVLRKARASGAQVHYIPMFLAAALGLEGNVDEARVSLADFLKFRPNMNSIAKVRADVPAAYGNPKFAALAERTFLLGLRRAGLPEE